MQLINERSTLIKCPSGAQQVSYCVTYILVEYHLVKLIE